MMEPAVRGRGNAEINAYIPTPAARRNASPEAAFFTSQKPVFAFIFRPMSEKPCICRPQVERTFDEMCQKGADETTALDAAFRVYRWYHPENASATGRALVESWVTRGALH